MNNRQPLFQKSIPPRSRFGFTARAINYRIIELQSLIASKESWNKTKLADELVALRQVADTAFYEKRLYEKDHPVPKITHDTRNAFYIALRHRINELSIQIEHRAFQPVSQIAHLIQESDFLKTVARSAEELLHDEQISPHPYVRKDTHVISKTSSP